jgi:hypothetical protein
LAAINTFGEFLQHQANVLSFKWQRLESGLMAASETQVVRRVVRVPIRETTIFFHDTGNIQ